MYVLHVRRFANTHFSHVNSSFLFTMKIFGTKIENFYSCFITFPVPHHSTFHKEASSHPGHKLVQSRIYKFL